MTEAADRYVELADEELDEAYEPPMAIEEYVDQLFERPQLAAHSTKYLLQAIEHHGTRTVVEEGERRERYRFFDDPYNDGEHAILGNTRVLNDFVDTVRSIASGRGKDDKMVWVHGPTATGKSEFKRCLVNGLREYSKTPEGRRYTVEWNVSSMHEWGSGEEDNWYTSPVQVHPLTVFPERVRKTLLEDLEEAEDDVLPSRVEGDIDPFSREAYGYLEERYRRKGRSKIFSAVTQDDHLRVKNYVVDHGHGIGVLHSEDSGAPKQRLVGTWMEAMLQKLDSRGRKNPQAFSYDGVLSQGNGLLTVVEDAVQHADLLQRLLNVSDEGSVKLDKGIRMDVDTLVVVISNPDLEAQIQKQAELDEGDPLKALKRRLEKHEFRYLTNLGLEADLLRREITGETGFHAEHLPILGSRGDTSTAAEENTSREIREPLHVEVGVSLDSSRHRELAPHTLEAAATYAVVTRLDDTHLSPGMTLIEKARLYDQGYVRRGDERLEKEDFDLPDDTAEGRNGIPVTYSRDVIADLLNTEPNRSHTELPVEEVITPEDVLDAMADGLIDDPLFSESEAKEYEEEVEIVREHVLEQQGRDVIDALTHDRYVDDETVEEYVEHVYAWYEDEPLEGEHGREEADPLKMKVFEVDHLGRFTDSDYTDLEPSSEVERFREDKVVKALNVQAWRSRDGFHTDEFDPREIPVLEDVVSTYDWSDVQRLYEDLTPSQWVDPPESTETHRLKQKTIDNMVEHLDYTAASAELASRRVMEEVEWD